MTCAVRWRGWLDQKDITQRRSAKALTLCEEPCRECTFGKSQLRGPKSGRLNPEGDAMPRRAWVLLKSGRRIDLLQPIANDWEDEDLALGLARTYRWGGHSAWDLPLSVAQHSLTVLAIREAFATKALTDAEALRELLHDAEEGLLSWDPISPIKPYLGAEYHSLA